MGKIDVRRSVLESDLNTKPITTSRILENTRKLSSKGTVNKATRKIVERKTPNPPKEFPPGVQVEAQEG